MFFYTFILRSHLVFMQKLAKKKRFFFFIFICFSDILSGLYFVGIGFNLRQFNKIEKKN